MQHFKLTDRLEIRTTDTTSDSSKTNDLFDNFETKLQNCETCVEAGITVSSVYKTVSINHR